MPRAIRFYQQLVLQLIVESLPDYARFCCPDGQASFSLSRVEKVPASQTLIYFECAALDQTVAHLQDPDGNPLCLYHAGENRLNPPWRLS